MHRLAVLLLLSLFLTEPVTSFKLPLPENTIVCPTTTPNTEEPTNTEGNAAANKPRIVIDNGVSHGIIPPTSFPQKTIQYGEISTAAPVETCVTDCVCPCGWVDPPKNYTDEELTAKVTEIQERLKVFKEFLSSTVRAKSSAKDHRTEAAAVGIVGVVFLVSIVGAIFLLDLTTIARDVRMLLGNLRQLYQP
ncbi:uncharacterized protein LOC132740611 [Ruditapes philippinarum]|uniref:uncharacterized protein LOC132740611 n=1 Tax=Ruditapes philippinarum TaxID=129788 RepID=UPI00295B0D90|nr:uncharacterized protein LOC132740611 [Ruditapes philippinarum]